MAELVIVSDPDIMSGIPCFRGTRAPFGKLLAASPRRLMEQWSRRSRTGSLFYELSRCIPAFTRLVVFAIPIIYSPDSSGAAGPARSYHMIASYYPTVSFILPHIGSYRTNQWWAHIEAIDLCKRYANIYLETSGLARLEYLEMAARDLLASRVLLGPYVPELDARVELYGVRLLKLPAEAKPACREEIFWT